MEDIKEVNRELSNRRGERKKRTFNDNIEIISGSKEKVEKNYEKLKKQSVPDESWIGRRLNLNKVESKKFLVATGIPTLATIVPLTIGTAGIVLAGAVRIMCDCSLDSEEVVRAAISTNNTLYNGSKDILVFAKNYLLSSLLLPLTTGVLAVPKTIIEDRKKKHHQEIVDDMEVTKQLLEFIDDLQSDKDDLGISFAKSFLSNVDITHNRQSFNIELLYRLSEYRQAVISSSKDSSQKTFQEEAFVELMKYIKKAGPLNGASTEFAKSTYVKGLLEYNNSNNRSSKLSSVVNEEYQPKHSMN